MSTNTPSLSIRIQTEPPPGFASPSPSRERQTPLGPRPRRPKIHTSPISPPPLLIPIRTPSPLSAISLSPFGSKPVTPNTEVEAEVTDGKRRIKTEEDLRALLALPNEAFFETLLSLDVGDVPTVVQLLYTEGLVASTTLPGSSEYRKRCMKGLRAVVKLYQTLPASLWKHVTKESEHPVGGGGSADVWKGYYENQEVCLKVPRYRVQAIQWDKANAAFCKEAMLWTQLNHRNVLPCLGVNAEVFYPACCLIAPWMPNGHIISFLEWNPGHDRLASIYEIASGLAYLHSLDPVVIHGDIKGANILVDENHNCRLADFGLAAVLETQIVKNGTSGTIQGSAHWMAPELFRVQVMDTSAPRSNDDKRPGDVYAWACTVFEVRLAIITFVDVEPGTDEVWLIDYDWTSAVREL
ncbi:hypothetical protein VNI00_019469 [Paramarasmius palmivorus]|uniref:Protein kinase domain-containing protein n=1 Tax=Paramarasmius palmivorus TaxID=297713 RepID=A0AAW0ALE5_9AGAR